MEIPQKIYDKYRINRLICPDAERELLREFLLRECKAIDATTSTVANALLAQIETYSEQQVCALLKPRLYDVDPKVFDPVKKQRRPEMAIEIFTAVSREIGTANNASEAARRAYAKSALFKETYTKGAKDLDTRYRQIKAQVCELQLRWDCTGDRAKKLNKHIKLHRYDPCAMYFVAKFCFYGKLADEARAIGDIGTLVFAGWQIDSVLYSGHPVAFGLAVLFANKPVEWLLTEGIAPLIEKLKGDDSRRELLAGVPIEGISAHEAINALLKVLAPFDLVPGKD